MINADKPQLWPGDIQASVAQYNAWFLSAAPKTYRNQRTKAIDAVEGALSASADMKFITPDLLRDRPSIISVLRMCTSPPLARDRLIGLAQVSRTLVHAMERASLPPRMKGPLLDQQLESICSVIRSLLDVDLLGWLTPETPSGAAEMRLRELAATVVADRFVGSVADPVIRNAQERRRLTLIERWLVERGYEQRRHSTSLPLVEMVPGTYTFRHNVAVGADRPVNIPIDVVVQPRNRTASRFPILIEAKSAGDFTNPNKRRKEEATKIRQLQATYGGRANLLLFLCGYFDAGYLGYEAHEGIDWVWEHRVDDLTQVGL